LDPTGLTLDISNAVINIVLGRKGFATRGKAEEGRLSFERGISASLLLFQQAQATADPLILLFAEFAFISQELALCDKSDTDTINSLTRAVRFFNDAFLALKAIDGLHYEAVEQAIPHDTDYRYKGYPLDAYHIACHNHKTRLKNILKVPGVDPIEKALLKQRLANMSTAQTAYVERQKKALKN